KNNKFNISIQVNEAPFVDLIPTNIVIDETPYDETYINISLEVEQQIELEARAKNIGNVETTFYAPNFLIAYYDSLTPLTPFLNEVVNSLEPEDKTSPYTASWKAPSVPGIYEVILFVDSTDVIPEGGLNAENNNKIHIFMNVTKEPLIDLILTNIKINDVLYSTRITSSVNTTNDTIIIIDLVTGQPIKISTQILNLGDTDTEEFSPEFYISYYNGTTIQSFEDDSFLHKSVKSSSPQNLSANYISNWTAPLTPGIYILNLFVDSTDLIPEGIALEYENNNKIELEFFVHELPLPPSPELDVSDEDVEIYWDDTSEVEYYNVYGGQTPDTIDFNLELGKTSKNYWAHGAWLDEYDEYYYVVRSIGKYEWMGTTSDIIGFKTIKFQRGYNTFSLPLEPFTAQSADWYLDEMFKSKSESGDIYKYDTTQQKWVGHPKGLPVGINDFNLLVGRTYMLYTSKDIEYTFVGRPGTTIKYIDGIEADPR
ncbi:MAG: hypothetical protein KAJ51_04685, partial [Thermoplasmata archaeon]|nr:hypothetical protein [Thermoplasmata archaeon]